MMESLGISKYIDGQTGVKFTQSIKVWITRAVFDDNKLDLPENSENDIFIILTLNSGKQNLNQSLVHLLELKTSKMQSHNGHFKLVLNLFSLTKKFSISLYHAFQGVYLSIFFIIHSQIVEQMLKRKEAYFENYKLENLEGEGFWLKKASGKQSNKAYQRTHQPPSET